MTNDVQRYAAAWRDRRRRMFVFRLAPILLLGGPIISFRFTEGLLPPPSDRTAARGIWIVAVFLLWLGAYAAVGVWLNRFRCPRCGGWYYWKWTWPPSWKDHQEQARRWQDCRHCGLHQDEVPAGAAGQP
jgi:hypothetical protein